MDKQTQKIKRGYFTVNGMRVKKSRFPLSIFWVYFIACSIMAGISQGIILLMEMTAIKPIIQVHLMLLYWIALALILTLYTRQTIKKHYETPLRQISKATAKVAKGDFSVFIPTVNTPDRLDYLDVMIMDLNRMIEELGSIETLKTDFVSNVSHEMKTPIAVIKNYAQLMKMPNTTEEQKAEFAGIIENAADRLANLITNILKLNKLENQKLAPQTECYDICRQVCDCLLQYEEHWEEKDIEIDVDTEDLIVVEADPNLMELVWNNLFSNAFKFTKPGGTVRVKVKTISTKTAIVTISDSGCGMSEETVKHIFDKFYQGDTSHSTEGNGLGMALVYRVLQLLDGEIDVQSEVGVGSTFTVTLPLAEAKDDSKNFN